MIYYDNFIYPILFRRRCSRRKKWKHIIILSHSMKFILKEIKKYSFLLVSFWEKFYIFIFSNAIKSCKEEKNWIVPYLFYLFKKNEFRFMPLEISMRHLEVVSVMLIVLLDKRLRITFYVNVTNWTMVAFCTWI